MGNKISAINGVKSPNFFEPGNAVNEIWFGDLEIISRLPFGDSDMAQAGWPKGDYPKIPWRPFIIPLQGSFEEIRKKLPAAISKLSRRTLPPPKNVGFMQNAGLAAIMISPLLLNCMILSALYMVGFVPRECCGRTPMAKRRIAICAALNLLSMGYLVILKYGLDAIFVGIEHLEDDVNHWTKVTFYPVIVLGNLLLYLTLCRYIMHEANCETKRIAKDDSEAGYTVRCTPRANIDVALAWVRTLPVYILAFMPCLAAGIYIWFWLEGWI